MNKIVCRLKLAWAGLDSKHQFPQRSMRLGQEVLVYEIQDWIAVRAVLFGESRRPVNFFDDMTVTANSLGFL